MIALRKHPFPVEAFFEKSLVLGFALPKEEIEHRIPPRLELDLLDEQWAFLAVALVKTRDLRPAGFPRIFGRDFTLIGYRIFVRYRNLAGRRLRGLYILGSETDKLSMRALGGIFTSYKYRHVSIDWSSGDQTESISSSEGLRVDASRFGGEIELPAESPFSDWREARRFAGPMPFTFSCDDERSVTLVEGVREKWTPVPMKITECEIPFFDGQKFCGLRLANAFLVEKVSYQWRRGKVEIWPD